jgi:hypothetical protein
MHAYNHACKKLADISAELTVDYPVADREALIRKLTTEARYIGASREMNGVMWRAKTSSGG